MDINSLREEIDALDEQITALIIKRMDCPINIAHIKASNGLAVLDKQREKDLLNKIYNNSKKYKNECVSIFEKIIDISKIIQETEIQSISESKGKL